MSRWLPLLPALLMGPAWAATPDVQHVARLIVAEANRAREHAGRKALVPDQKLVRAAQGFADYMARTDRFDHDADGSNPGERMRRAGYRWCYYAENIAYEFHSRGFGSEALARALVADWLGSSGHRRNLLDARMRETGVGIAQSPRTHRWYGVQVFGTPCATSAR